MKGILLIILASFCWALDTLIRYPLIGEGFNPIRLVYLEHLLLVVLFIPVYIKSHKVFWNTSIGQYFYFFIIGGLGSALATFWFTSAFKYLNPTVVILLQKFQPIVAIFFARIVLGEKVNSKFIAWTIVCFIGALLISYPDLQALKKVLASGNWNESGLFWGYTFTLLAVFCWGATTVFGKKLANSFSETQIMAGRYFFGLITAAFILGLDTAIDFNISLQNYGKIASLVVLVGLFSMYIYYKGLKLIPAKLCTLAEMFFPFCAVTVNWLFLGKTLGLEQILGAIVLLIGSSVIQLKHY